MLGRHSGQTKLDTTPSAPLTTPPSVCVIDVPLSLLFWEACVPKHLAKYRHSVPKTVK